ncbi:MAG: M23 family metallopeptidase [Oscillospiraceae bacterium]|nr:M23 family metallopeptidase [Oscillospiraceae bacterium]
MNNKDKNIIHKTSDILSGIKVKPAKLSLRVLFLVILPEFFHDLGKSVCEIISDLIDGVLLFTGRFIGFIWLKTEKFRTFLYGKLKYSAIFVLSPFLKLADAYSLMRKEVKAANREYGLRGAIPAFFKHFLAFVFGKRGGGAVTTVFNYVVPVISIIFLINVISYASEIEYAVRLEVNGSFVGYIENERTFTEAEKIYEQRLNFLGSVNMIEITPYYTIEKLGYSRTLTTAEVTNILIEKSGVSVEWAYGVIINNNFMGAVSDNTSIVETLDELLSVHKTGIRDEEVAFVWDIDVEQGGQYPSESIIDPQIIIRSITRKGEEAQFYTVVEGDAHLLIADKLDIDMTELERLNPGFSEQMLMPGDRIRYSAEVPYLPVSVTRTEIYDHPIPYTTEYRDDESLFINSVRTAVEGQYGYDRITARVTLVNDIETNRETIARELVSLPVTQVVLRGTRPLPSGQVSNQAASYGKFIWPVPMAHKVSEWGWWDGGYGRHSGVDIGAPYGTPIFAGESGMVVHSGNLGGYGNTVIIEHDNGLRTLYAHASALNVRVGQSVIQGETIAFVGATGRADGNHVHFEVRYGGTILNPKDYLEFWY